MSDPAPAGVDEEQAIDSEAGRAPADQTEAEANQVANEVAQQQTGNKMHVKVHSPYKIYFDGLAVSLSAENLTGPFDVLPHHHNFISLLTPCDLIIRPEDDPSKTTRILISGGLLHVKADSVVVFLDV